MLKNNVFNPNVNTVEWMKKAGIRALKTAAQTALSMITVGQAVMDVNWVNVLSISAVAALTSVLTSIVGIPEVEKLEVKESEE